MSAPPTGASTNKDASLWKKLIGGVLEGLAWFFFATSILAAPAWFLLIASDNLLAAARILLSPGVAASLLSLVAPRVGIAVLGAMERERKASEKSEEASNKEETVKSVGELLGLLKELVRDRFKQGLVIVYSQILALFTSLMLILIASIAYLIEYLCRGGTAAWVMRGVSAFSVTTSLFLLVWLFMREGLAETPSWDPIRAFVVRELARSKQQGTFKHLRIQIREDRVFLMRLVIIVWGFAYAAIDVMIGQGMLKP